MVFKPSILLLISTFIWNTFAQSPGPCYKWVCDPQLGKTERGASRLCSQLQSEGNEIHANGCEPEASYLCDVKPFITKEEYCSETVPFPWREQLPSGDVCDYDAQCASNVCFNVTSTCNATAAVVESCTSDIDWEAQHFCSRDKGVCTPNAGLFESWFADLRCNFGQAWVNGTCQKYGSISKATQFYIEDNERMADQDTDHSLHVGQVCSTFVAFKTEKVDPDTDLPIYMCISGYEKEFAQYGSDSVRNCYYALNFGNGTIVRNSTSTPAVCGYNIDDKIYCPMKRSEKYNSIENENDAKTWANVPETCHHFSKGFSCRDISTDTALTYGIIKALGTSWKTQLNNYPFIANSNQCIGITAKTTAIYWRVFDKNLDTHSDGFSQVST